MAMRFSTTRMSLVGCAVTAALLLPAAASGATASLDRACYPGDDGADIVITGSGFAPNDQVQLMVAGGIVGVASTDASGNVSTTFPVPKPPTGGKSKNDKGYEISLVQGTTTVSATFRSALVMADFSPGDGNPLTLRVRFSVWGFGVATPTGQPMPKVYMHYVDPRGKLKKTVMLGTGTAPCVTIAKTKLRKLFPFSPRKGNWTLQFDTNPLYHRGTGVSRFLFNRIGLTVSG
jgi:hypothetical protein